MTYEVNCGQVQARQLPPELDYNLRDPERVELLAQPATSYVATLVTSEPFKSLFGGEVKLIQANASDEEMGGVVTKLPVYFTGGYGVDNVPYLVNLAEEHGRNAFSLSHTGVRKKERTFIAITQTSSINESSTVRMKDARNLLTQPVDLIISKHQINKAATLLTAMAVNDIERADAIFQSEGALHGILAARAAPDKFRNIVLAYPAGVSRQDRPRKAYRGVIGDTISKYHPSHRVATANSFKGYSGTGSEDIAMKYAQSRHQGTFVDCATVALSDQGLILTGLRQQEEAPGVTLVAGLEDRIFPPERLMGSLRSSEDIDFMLVTHGLHGIHYRKDVMDQIASLFSIMEARKAEREAARKNGQKLTPQPLRDRLILPPNIPPQRAKKLYDLADQV